MEPNYDMRARQRRQDRPMQGRPTRRPQEPEQDLPARQRDGYGRQYANDGTRERMAQGPTAIADETRLYGEPEPTRMHGRSRNDARWSQTQPMHQSQQGNRHPSGNQEGYRHGGRGRRPQDHQWHDEDQRGMGQERSMVVHPAGSTRIPITGGNPYSTTSGRPGAPRRRSVVVPILIALLLVLLIAGVAFGFLVLRKPRVNVTVNGQEIQLVKGATLEDAKRECDIETSPGRLLAVDGSVIDEKGGTQQTVVVNGQEIPESDYGSFEFTANGTEVEFSDGRDETEGFSSEEQVEGHETRDFTSTANDYWTGAVHRYQHGQDGIKTTKRGETSGIEVTEETQARQDDDFLIYSVDTGGDKVVALTFDDGPWDESTDAILDILEENGAKATFFTVGQQVSEHAEQVRRQKDLGCQTCTHTWDHAAGSGEGVNLTYMSSDEQIQEIQKGYEALREVLGEEPLHIMRAPGGNFYNSIVNTLKPYVDVEIGWDVDTEDWKQPGADIIYERIMNATPGQIVLMHDGGGDRSQTVEAVRRAVPELIANGYRLVTISELLDYGIPPTARSMSDISE